MRQHYHIWLIGAACALAVLAIGSVFSLLEVRSPSGAQATPTTVQLEPVPLGDRAATATEPKEGVAGPATQLPHTGPDHVPAAAPAPQLLAVPGPGGRAQPLATPAEVR
jgi:hypothetical protein